MTTTDQYASHSTLSVLIVLHSPNGLASHIVQMTQAQYEQAQDAITMHAKDAGRHVDVKLSVLWTD